MGFVDHFIRRLLLVIPTVLIASVIVFLLVHLAPGDPVLLLAGQDATAQDIENIRAVYGLNKPLIDQYFIWISRVLQGDLGRSIITRRGVLEELIPRLGATMELALAAMTISTVLGILTGVVSAVKRNSVVDGFLRLIVIFGISMPVFWLGIVLILIFSVELGLFPSFGTGGIEHLILPAITLSAFSLAVISRTTRSSMLETLRQDYIRTARAKGAPHNVVIYKHALLNASIPIVTIIGLQLGVALTGAVLTEMVFAWPGLGRALVTAILARDYPTVQGALLIIVIIVIFVNLATDLAYSRLDPRIRV